MASEMEYWFHVFPTIHIDIFFWAKIHFRLTVDIDIYILRYSDIVYVDIIVIWRAGYWILMLPPISSMPLQICDNIIKYAK